jgi:hypothetical protein
MHFAIFIIVLMLSISPVSAFADEIKNPTPLSITSGLIIDEEVQESTFDDSRMVYGETVPFADITVTVCHMEWDGSMLEDYRDDFEVGSLGIFSMSLPLNMGTNYIEITVTDEEYDEATYSYELKRKPQAVKDELKNMIALPGLMPKHK